jgi:hypothetical protein
MEPRVSTTYARKAQLLADMWEYLDVIRYPARAEMLRAVGEAAQRADSLARLERELQRTPGSR